MFGIDFYYIEFLLLERDSTRNRIAFIEKSIEKCQYEKVKNNLTLILHELHLELCLIEDDLDDYAEIVWNQDKPKLV